MSHIRALLLDFGGTLDADGVHWSTLYARAFAEAGLELDRKDLDRAFLTSEDEFERAPGVEGFDLEGHVSWQVLRMLELLIQAGHLSGQCVEELTGVVQPSPCKAAASSQRVAKQGEDGRLPRRTSARAKTALEILTRRLTALAVQPMRRTLEVSRRLLLEHRSRFAFALISNFTPNLHVILKREGLTDLFDHVFCSSSVGLRKPDPEIFHLALSSLGVEPEEACMVGDSLTADIMPAKELGLTTCWIRGDRVFIKGDESAADHEVQDLAESLMICSGDGRSTTDGE